TIPGTDGWENASLHGLAVESTLSDQLEFMYETAKPMSFEPIENHGVIGNMCSIALVGVNGSIDFLCYPNFDSPTVFAALLDDQRGGSFQVQPQLKEKRVRQLYLPETNILLTRFLAEEGVAELTDY